MNPRLKLLVTLGAVAALWVLLADPALAHDCFARLMRGEWSSGDCGNTSWDEMAPILAFGAVVAAVAAAAALAVAAPGLAMAVGVGMTAYAVASGYQKDGLRGVFNEFSPHNDFYNAYTATNPWDRARHILTGGLKTLGLIPFLRPFTQGARALVNGMARAGGRAAQIARNTARSGRMADDLARAGQTVPRAARPPAAGRTAGQADDLAPRGGSAGNRADDPLWNEFQRIEQAERLARARAARLRNRQRREAREDAQLDRIDRQIRAEDAARRHAAQQRARAEEMARRQAEQQARIQRMRDARIARQRQVAAERDAMQRIRDQRYRDGAGINQSAPRQSSHGGSTPRQIQQNGCGLSALEGCAVEQGLASRTQGHNIATAMRNKNFDPNAGMTVKQVAAEAQARGLNRQITHTRDVFGPTMTNRQVANTLRNVHPDGKSALMLVDNGGGGYHYVKFEGFNASGRKMYFSDPWTGEFHSMASNRLGDSIVSIVTVWK